MTTAPLFVTGTARSGTNLVARMLDAHPQVAVACDPYFPLVRSLRDAALRAAELAPTGPLPLEDYYGDDARIERLDAVQAAELDSLRFDPDERNALQEALAARASLDAADLVPHLAGIEGATYRELFDSAFETVARARGAVRVAGTKEVWAVEFLAPLAAAYPDATFVVIRRDPRAVVASMLELARTDPSQRAHVLSYARHWRKEQAFVERYAADPALAERLTVVRYEELVTDPETAAAALCAAIGVEPADSMLDTTAFRDASGGAWRINSSYADAAPGIAADRTERWRTELDRATLALVELVCAPELELEGYTPSGVVTEPDELLDLLAEEDTAPVSWRSDLGDPRADLDLELTRRRMLASDTVHDETETRRLFLFPAALARLRERAPARASA